MSIETFRKIKAFLLLVLLVGAEARHIEQDARFNGLRSSHSARTASGVAANDAAPSVERLAGQMREMMTGLNLQETAKGVAEHVKSMMSNPHFQEHAKRFAELMETMKTNPYIQEQAKLVAEKIEVTLFDPQSQQHLKSLAKQIEAMRADVGLEERLNVFAKQMDAIRDRHDFKEQAKILGKQIEAMRTDPGLQEHAKRVAKQLEALQTDPNLQEQATRVAEQVATMRADPRFQEQANLIREEMETLFSQQAKRFAQEDKFVGKWADKLAEKLVGRAEAPHRFHGTGLDSTTLMKSKTITTPGMSLRHVQGYDRPRSGLPHLPRQMPPAQSTVVAAMNPVLRNRQSVYQRRTSVKSNSALNDDVIETKSDSAVQNFFFPDKEELPEDVEMPIWDHLEELRERILLATIALILAILVAFAFSKDIVVLLEAPIANKGVKFLQLSPGEFFFTSLKVSGYSGLLASLPVIFYQLGAWVAPGLTNDEKKFVSPIFSGSCLLFVTGVLFSYKFLAPAALSFFVNFAEGAVESVYSIDQYFEFILTLMISVGLAFQIPVVQLILGQFGILTSEKVFSSWKYVVVGVTVASAVLTPSTDPITQTLLTVPLLGLYMGGGVALKVLEETRSQQSA